MNRNTFGALRLWLLENAPLCIILRIVDVFAGEKLHACNANAEASSNMLQFEVGKSLGFVYTFGCPQLK